MTYICIEAIIGAGKSSLLNYIYSQNKPIVSISQEPVELFRYYTNPETKVIRNPLNDFYTDIEKNSLNFQVFVANLFLQQEKGLIMNDPTKIIIQERSSLTGVNTFAKLLNITDYALDSLKSLIESAQVIDFTIYIYLKIDAKNSIERIKKRNRSEESSVSEDYQKLLIGATEKYLNELKTSKHLIVIDATKSIPEMYEELKYKLGKLNVNLN